MSFGRNNYRAGQTGPDRPKKAPVFCVGWQAFVNWPQPAGTKPRVLPMTDANGTPIANDLADGQAVEIVSWRPQSRECAAYQIRRSADGREGWIAATCLRHAPEAPKPVEAATAPQD